ncbi:hypothetical protein [Luteolibacter soli]|uniref:Verru_Chthon cassette protein A n=1 Tax=Luteolibacter soli TaxID=3135280 RepID=A0ABU9AML0_9BACT
MVSLSLMVLITVLATGLLGLASIELRKSSSTDARAAASANARLGLMLALGQLQKTLGDDRRVTADSSILSSTVPQPNLVGAWQSSSTGLLSNPSGSVGAQAYDKPSKFKGWLVADPEPKRTLDQKMAESAPEANGVKIFRADSDGFEIEVPRVPTTDGAYSWAVSQEGTRAKINVGGPENSKRNPNDDIIAQARPNLALSHNYKQPEGDWDSRTGRVLSVSQSKLDETLAGTDLSGTASHDYTAHSMGLITNAVRGGLKVDLNLGFEMSDTDFAKDTFSAGYPNPFRAAAAEFTGVQSSYRGQRPLFKPLYSSATHTARLDNFDAAKVLFDYPGSGVPTFDLLRKFYRIPYHLYTTSGDGLTVFERPFDHIAFAKTATVPSGLFRTPWNTPNATTTQGSIRPVVDRVMFLLSTGLTAASEPCVVITPVVTLWNPYNVALEIEGAVAYPWLDVPFAFAYRLYNPDGTEAKKYEIGASTLLGRQLKSVGHGRSVDPYLYAAITSNGSRISGTPAPIRFQPGEVRVFTPASSARQTFTPVDYSSPSAQVSITGITTYLRPVASLSDFSTKGGLEVKLTTEKMAATQTADMTFTIVTGEDYPCFISVEDATRAKGTTATTGTRGQAIMDVLQRYYGQSGEFGQTSAGRSSGFKSTKQSYAVLQKEPAPFAALEFYHRYAKTGQDQSADLVYTGNPRQPWMSSYMTNATFPSGPQYKLRVRGPLTTFGNLLEVENGSGGRRAFYGPSNTAKDGKSKLPFFEIPRAPMLSLAEFQNADLTFTPFGPANQFANSWASAYIARNKVGIANTAGADPKPTIYDTAFLANEALWDGFFFSGAAPVIEPTSGSGSANVWTKPNAPRRQLSDVLEKFVNDPQQNPLRNPRMRLVKGDRTETDLIRDLEQPEGCMKIAAHLMVDGAFNINSTSVEAWTALLSGLRGSKFAVDSGSAPASSSNPFPRFHYPSGAENDDWNGFKTLTDAQIKTLAQNIVHEVEVRGPFLSLAEFVNRRVSTDPSGLKGAIQTAIDNTTINQAAGYDTIGATALALYPITSKSNISPLKTGVGIPGYLTQADVLQSLAPVITPRSDTFTIRGYGEAHDSAGKIIATATCEAVVQRYADFVDTKDDAYTPVANLNPVNAKFGRRFKVVSFRYLSVEEMRS